VGSPEFSVFKLKKASVISFASRIFVLWLTFYIFVETVSCLNFSERLIDCKLVKKRKAEK
ncbi:MAG: hypothetical protein IKD10_12085, partial [Lentisphaeria bacterium]|nr:hypothetical protein [Lentisphaeria bacterium]